MFSNAYAQKILITIRHILLAMQRFVYVKLYGMNIGEDVRISLKANLDKRNPKGVYIDDGAYVAFRATILCHDMSRNVRRDVKIGKNCFIGAQSIIMPGVTVGEQSIVAAGAVVTKDVPPHSIVAGNPAQIIRQGVNTIKWGRIVKNENQ